MNNELEDKTGYTWGGGEGKREVINTECLKEIVLILLCKKSGNLFKE